MVVSFKKHIPNFFTSLNLFFGILALLSVFKPDFEQTALFILFSLICDFLDGFLARILNARSEIGKQMDSLADLISFGLVPGAIMFTLLKISKAELILFDENILPYFGYLITIFSAFRLAKFNTDSKQENSFIGLPTPANAILILAFALMQFYILSDSVFGAELSTKAWFLLLLTALSCFLLIGNIPLLAFKFKKNDTYKNRPQYIIIAISIILLVWLKIAALPLIIMVYILLSQFFKEKA